MISNEKRSQCNHNFNAMHFLTQGQIEALTRAGRIAITDVMLTADVALEKWGVAFVNSQGGLWEGERLYSGTIITLLDVGTIDGREEAQRIADARGLGEVVVDALAGYTPPVNKQFIN